MTDEQRKWYNRGYTARTRCSWPEHLPPHPPDKTLRQILDASSVFEIKRTLCKRLSMRKMPALLTFDARLMATIWPWQP